MELIIILAVLVVLAVILVLIYNGMVRKRNQVDNAFAGIDAILKKRYDLIPNLVSTVKNYMTHERETLNEITELRSKAQDGNLSQDEQVDVNNKLSQAMGKLMVAVEAYPDLKANENFMHLQRSLNEVESQLSAARRAFNASVTAYNNSIQTFPNVVFAGMFNFKARRVFEATAQERENVNVGNLFDNQ